MYGFHVKRRNEIITVGEEQILRKVLTKIFAHERCERGIKKKCKRGRQHSHYSPNTVWAIQSRWKRQAGHTPQNICRLLKM
jgi:hypothetical protein